MTEARRPTDEELAAGHQARRQLVKGNGQREKEGARQQGEKESAKPNGTNSAFASLPTALSAKAFVDGYVAPEYLIDGLL
jgi:hypothetical protein